MIFIFKACVYKNRWGWIIRNGSFRNIISDACCLARPYEFVVTDRGPMTSLLSL
jgi:hypothetical protein